MVRRKNPRDRGKIKFSRAFQNLELGDHVSISREAAMKKGFPTRIQGSTGTIEEKRGKSVVVKMNDGKKQKRFIIDPVHLKKIKYEKQNGK